MQAMRELRPGPAHRADQRLHRRGSRRPHDGPAHRVPPEAVAPGTARALRPRPDGGRRPACPPSRPDPRATMTMGSPAMKNAGRSPAMPVAPALSTRTMSTVAPLHVIRPRQPKPEWLKVKAPGSENYLRLSKLMRGLGLNTVCEEARCPNIGECWHHGTATFMILGDVCTRACGYCAVAHGKPATLDLDEPRRVADAVKVLGLQLRRDHLGRSRRPADGGSGIFAETIRRTRELSPDCRIEVLIPDFQGKADQLQTVLDARPGRAEPQHRDGAAPLPEGAQRRQVQPHARAAAARQGVRAAHPDQDGPDGRPRRGDAGARRGVPRPARDRGRHPHDRPVPAARPSRTWRWCATTRPTSSAS